MITDFTADSQLDYELTNSTKTNLEPNNTYDRVAPNNNFEKQNNDISIELREQRVALKELNNNLEKRSDNISISSKNRRVSSTESVPKSRKRSKPNLAPVSRTTRSRTKITFCETG